VHTIREALVLLGSARVRQWIALTLLEEHRRSNTESVFAALVRAKACELLAGPAGLNADTAFTAGLISALDLMLGVPVDELTKALDLDPALKRIAFERSGETGALVAQVADFQDALAHGFPHPPDPALGHPVLSDAIADAIAWAAPQVTALTRC
jgi:EAL and modified HD-GYP domain-containing signal transduction protein